MLDIETWVIDKGGTKKGVDGKSSGWVGEKLRGLLDLVALVRVWVYFCCSGGCLCRGIQELGLCTISTVVLSAGGECEGGRFNVVTGWGKIGGGGEDRGREWMTRGRKSS
jgi:hypothetical protein